MRRWWFHLNLWERKALRIRPDGKVIVRSGLGSRFVFEYVKDKRRNSVVHRLPTKSSISSELDSVEMPVVFEM